MILPLKVRIRHLQLKREAHSRIVQDLSWLLIRRILIPIRHLQEEEEEKAVIRLNRPPQLNLFKTSRMMTMLSLPVMVMSSKLRAKLEFQGGKFFFQRESQRIVPS
jgi:hypothetical protein